MSKKLVQRSKYIVFNDFSILCDLGNLETHKYGSILVLKKSVRVTIQKICEDFLEVIKEPQPKCIKFKENIVFDKKKFGVCLMEYVKEARLCVELDWSYSIMKLIFFTEIRS